jgi:hypothetical protein
MTTVFKCSRCGYENETLYLFKKHFERKTECKPKVSNIALSEVKESFKKLIDPPIVNNERNNESPKLTSPKTPKTPKTLEIIKRKKKLRNFGDENLEYIKKDNLKDYVKDPLKGIQEIIKITYFDSEHPENHIVRSVIDDNDIDYNNDIVEIHYDDLWVKKPKKYIYNKMIYLAYGIMEYNILKKLWTHEFKNFITSMDEMDNDDLLELICEELEETFMNGEKELEFVKTT